MIENNLMKRIKFKIKSKLKAKNYFRKFQHVPELVEWHFNYIKEPNHVSRKGIEIALSAFKNKPVRILETGTSAWGTDSTRLWASYIYNFGGVLDSIDLREEPRKSLGHLGDNVNLLVGDSLKVIPKIIKDSPKCYDLIYLDSFDVDWASPLPSANHGLKEFNCIRPLLKSGTLVLIDDTPNSLSFIPNDFHEQAKSFRKNFGVLPGKGALILNQVPSEIFKVIYHGYNLLLRIN